MATAIRLARRGSKKHPTYRIVVADSRRARDGRFIESIGFYNPQSEPSVIEVDEAKAKEWLKNGAQPSDTVRKLFTSERHRLGERAARILGSVARGPSGPGSGGEIDTPDGVLLRLTVAKEDVGKVIGKQGRIARAIRTVVKASAVKDGKPGHGRDRGLRTRIGVELRSPSLRCAMRCVVPASTARCRRFFASTRV